MDERVSAAHNLAVTWHAGELRKYTATPYIVHPEAVARLISTVPHTWQMLAAALLHDVLEVDECLADSRRLIIFDKLGCEVADLVLEMTNPSKPSDGNRAMRKAIDRAHLAKASSASQTLRLADAIDNLESLAGRDPFFARTYAREKSLIIPLTLQGDAVLHARFVAAVDKIL